MTKESKCQEDLKCNDCGSSDSRLVSYDTSWGIEYDVICNKCGSNDFTD